MVNVAGVPPRFILPNVETGFKKKHKIFYESRCAKANATKPIPSGHSHAHRKAEVLSKPPL